MATIVSHEWPDSGALSSCVNPQDAQILQNLAIKYGVNTLIQTLQSLEESARYSTLSVSSTSSHPSVTSAVWNRSDDSLCASDATSFHGSMHSVASWHDTVAAGGVPAFLSTPPLSETTSPSGTVALADWAEPLTASSASPLLGPYLEPSRKPRSLLAAPTSSPRVAFPPSPRPSSSPHCGQATPITTTTTSTAARKPIECPLCAVYDIAVGFRRKSDFKKHLQNFHPTDSLWACPQPGCRTVFDVERAYVHHIRTEHPCADRDRDHNPALPLSVSPDAARQQLCPQLVFACGFLGCKAVLEARDASDSAAVADRYFDHVAAHLVTKPALARPPSEWTYYTQMQNLLRQAALKEDWKAASWNKTVRTHLRWQPRSSGDLKKLLETRHLGDVPRLLHAAFTLGSSSFADPAHPPPPSFPGASSRPVRGRCPLSTAGEGVCAVSSPSAVALATSANATMTMTSTSTSTSTATATATTTATTPTGGLGLRRGLQMTPLRIVTSGAAAAGHGVGGGCLSAPFLSRIQPPPRSVPEEPDSVDGHPHPGTPFVVPETESWADDEDSLFGPPLDAGLFGPAAHPVAASLKGGYGLLQPPPSGVVSSEVWAGAEMVRGQAHEEGASASPRTPNKRGLSWGRRSWEGSRFMKRRGAHFSEARTESS
ncbi:hypothetical protein SODALDRAFT_330885 [Sodiomyces alkalinus F11]|uniref:C2H2-type domain-containing protein n=1 Tax=Sodiomyces alkalinus (strain CBS 110278 / VKM F-3762 / F11) TaxID=1314773 RepID=A0A3N2Q330_SODAK|nr:hypothetical protein SODALDRAFT_330885 [Sodiomyces alkalinus F11]ROT41174.1 hypothetical protein SODALDRAFT_330885 [Sodiomyces alkalinus F11]